MLVQGLYTESAKCLASRLVSGLWECAIVSERGLHAARQNRVYANSVIKTAHTAFYYTGLCFVPPTLAGQVGKVTERGPKETKRLEFKRGNEEYFALSAQPTMAAIVK